ncbi:hypothetical protein GCM10022295_89330 [Streptomyces osmaniensis]|uniref:DDE Tnp4 domain-containing protein n=1 Tax=Streptomyces osmaniensis TaxID=593134 RepID=A0ABP6YYX0_9ACTN
MSLAHLRNGQPCAQLAAGIGYGIGIGTTTAYRYIAEAVELLAALAPTLAEAVRTAPMKAYLILDGTLLPIDRMAADRPFYPGKHKKHSMNVQVIADPKGRPLRASPALAGAVHDVRAARKHGIIDALTRLASTAGRTRATRTQAARSVSLTAADGTVSPPVSRPSTGPTRRSGHWSNKPSPPSSPGGSCASSAARRPGSRASSKLSSPSIWPAQTGVGAGQFGVLGQRPVGVHAGAQDVGQDQGIARVGPRSDLIPGLSRRLVRHLISRVRGTSAPHGPRSTRELESARVHQEVTMWRARTTNSNE